MFPFNYVPKLTVSHVHNSVALISFNIFMYSTKTVASPPPHLVDNSSPDHRSFTHGRMSLLPYRPLSHLLLLFPFFCFPLHLVEGTHFASPIVPCGMFQNCYTISFLSISLL